MLVTGGDLIHTLNDLYLNELSNIQNTYKNVVALDGSLLSELKVDVNNIKENLKQKIKNCKNKYWRELFDNLEVVTCKLTSDSRQNVINKLMANTHVDFSVKNARAILVWVLKNVNDYIDTQFISTMEKLVRKANIENYKSNQKVFEDSDWRYCRKPEGLTKYMFDYRIVLSDFHSTDSCWSRGIRVADRTKQFVNDLMILAYNVGFDTINSDRPNDVEWQIGKWSDFFYKVNGEDKPLLQAKAFKNGNLHLRFDPDLMKALNVEFGRLKGWLNSASDAASETGYSVKTVERYFGSNIKLKGDTLLRIGVK